MSKKRRSVVRRSSEPENMGSPLTTPLSPSVVYHYPDVDQLKAVYEKKAEGFTYARYGNPNSAVLADKISWMENAQGGVMTASGMSALSTVFLGILAAGDAIAVATQLYGQSLKMTSQVLPRLGFKTTFFDASDPDAFAKAIRPGTKIILAEIVSNPMLRVTDFQALTRVAKDVGALLVIDNTFTTPSGFNPLDHGADMVMHSVTKMLSGHSDLTLGYIGANNQDLLNKLDEAVATLGLNASPYNCWLAERGLHTFDLRLKQAQDNAGRLSRLLSKPPKVSKVHYPGLSTFYGVSMKRTHIAVVIAICFVVFQLLGQVKDKYQARDWPDTEGVISLASIADTRRLEYKEIDGYKTGREVVEYSLVVSYDYNVDGIAYQGNRLGFVENKTRSLSSVESLLTEFSPGKSVKVFYNPDFPEDSVLVK
ncbi:MAG: PLP-dependent transferase [Motiliproteus sp.]